MIKRGGRRASGGWGWVVSGDGLQALPALQRVAQVPCLLSGPSWLTLDVEGQAWVSLSLPPAFLKALA